MKFFVHFQISISYVFLSKFNSLGSMYPWIKSFSTLIIGIQAKYSYNVNKFRAALSRREFKWTASLPTTTYSNTFISNH